MMRTIQALLVLLMLPFAALAQSKVSASEIIAKINRGEAVAYKNVEVTGNLDMTKLQNMKLKSQKNSYGTKEYISTVTAPLTFVNCTFTGDVLAYYSPSSDGSWIKNSNEVYNTNFKAPVRFESCIFEQESAFKYSEFDGEVSFEGSRFADEALFKYAEFSKAANFSNARFRGDANFKYAVFPMKSSFAGASFGNEANFKYTKFQDGVTFQKAVFVQLANFKYTKFYDEINFSGASFKGSDDFKYTELNNRQVSLTTLLQRND